MKLIELLVKREQWPSNAHQAAQDDDGYVWFYTFGKLHRRFLTTSWTIPHNSIAKVIGDSKFHAELTTDASTAIITREQYEAALKPAWNGEGLPSLGCECEYSLNGGRRWDKCKIEYAVGTQGVVISCDVFEGVQYVSFIAYPKTAFRPVRPEAEHRREESTEAMRVAWRARAGEEDDGKLKSIYEIIYDAIAAHKIPGVCTVPTVSEIVRATEKCSREDAQRIVNLLTGGTIED